MYEETRIKRVMDVMDFSDDDRTEKRRRRTDIGGGIRLTWDSDKTAAKNAPRNHN
jgi:hypothetical protein